VALSCARTDADQIGSDRDRASSGDERSQNFHLAMRGVRWKCAAQSVPHARSPAAASHSSRPSIGMV